MAPRLEALLPRGGRPRQLAVRTLVVGMLLAAADGRPAHLSRVHQALLSLPEPHRWRLGILAMWRGGPHTLTYRQVERTFSLVVHALRGAERHGEPSQQLGEICDALLEASIPQEHAGTSASLAVDWTDHATWGRPPTGSQGAGADPDASWGHRRGHAPGASDELFYGYYPQIATMVPDEGGPPVPELVRRMALTSCHVDPPPALVGVLQRMARSGIALGDVLADSGYAHRLPQHWALPLRAHGARLIQDLHPHDRGPRGTFGGAVVANGNLYCPATPQALLRLGPLPPQASDAQAAAHDTQTTEAARYKLARISAPDTDGFHRVVCPAVAGKLRCPLREQSMSLPHDRPQILDPPPLPPRCCSQKTLTVPPEVAAKTAQAHDYPSAAWRRSYARRAAAERAFATIKDPASIDVRRGWCRVMGLEAITLFLLCAVVTRNHRILAAFEARTQRRVLERPPRQRRRKRTLADLVQIAQR